MPRTNPSKPDLEPLGKATGAWEFISEVLRSRNQLLINQIQGPPVALPLLNLLRSRKNLITRFNHVTVLGGAVTKP